MLGGLGGFLYHGGDLRISRLDIRSELAIGLSYDPYLDAPGRTDGAIQRRRGDGNIGGTTRFRASLAGGFCGKSLPEAALRARRPGSAEIGAQSLTQRLHRPVAFLLTILRRLPVRPAPPALRDCP